MLPENKKEFVSLLKTCLEVYGQALPSQDVTKIWWATLEKNDISQIRASFEEHIKHSKFAPRPADILEIIEKISPNGRPSADEAWAMMPRDEYASAVMTQEMADALHIAQPLLDEGDQVAARMAFKDSYNRAVEKNKRANLKPVWFASLGWDKQGRESVVREAVLLGRLPEKQLLAMGFTPEKEMEKIGIGEVKRLAAKMTGEMK